MADFAISSDPAVQCQLERLTLLSPGADILGLDRITRLLARVGDPQLRLPPVLHVAGTNGKGSTCAYLRAAIEAAGMTAHVYSSPHLVRFNERIRVAGTLISDAVLAPLLAEVLDAGGDIGASFFEVTTAAAFLAFARTPADACIVEVGLGGRLDATNVIAAPAVTAIAQLGIDHQAFLGDTAEAIAAEKAGIAKPGVPLVTMAYSPEIAAVIGASAAQRGATWQAEGAEWRYAVGAEAIAYADGQGSLTLPLPALAGPHQPGNLALATAILRHQTALTLPDSAYAEAARAARWPARMQRLGAGPLTARLPAGAEVWLDGGHNAAAGDAVAGALRAIVGDSGRPVTLVLGMLANKDADGLLDPLAPLADRVIAVPVPGHAHHAPEEIAAAAAARGVAVVDIAAGPAEALARIAADSGPAPIVLIAGSLYLAGGVLAANGELPD
ncbi:bifunctional folylpolyglutamate synthase/dihydrofolate synthase [Sphingomonas sp. CJ20]